MCGIAGGFWFDEPIAFEQKINKAISSMRFRGPNDSGYKVHSSSNSLVAIAHVRLSIIDLSDAGHQPMYSANNRFGIVFNGEIYNFLYL